MASSNGLHRQADEGSKMVGGAKFQDAVLTWSKQSNNLFLTLFGITLVLWTTFAEKLPAIWRWQLSTTFGRLLLLLLLYITYLVTDNWVLTLIFTIAIALTWANRPIYNPAPSNEGFANGAQQDVKVTAVQGKPWFVEKTLRENPSIIVEDRVTTSAVQDDSQGSPGRVSR